MSSRSYFVFGYGINVEDVTKEKLIAFILNHENTLLSVIREARDSGKEDTITEEELLEMCKAGDTWDLEEDFYDYSGDFGSGIGLRAIIANVMRWETGIRFAYEYDSDEGLIGGPSVILEYMPPWTYNEKEAKLTQDEMDAILRKYADELGIKSEPDSLEIEYFN